MATKDRLFLAEAERHHDEAYAETIRGEIAALDAGAASLRQQAAYPERAERLRLAVILDTIREDQYPSDEQMRAIEAGAASLRQGSDLGERRDAIMRRACELSPAAEVDDELICCTYEQLSHIVTEELESSALRQGDQTCARCLKLIDNNNVLHARLDDCRARAITEMCEFLEKRAKEGYHGEDVDGDYLAAQSIREKFLAAPPSEGSR